MANNILTMLQIRHVLQLLQSGNSKRKISRITGISRNTIKEYIVRARNIGMAPESLLKLNDQELGTILYPEKKPDGDARDGNRVSVAEWIKKKIEDLKETGVTRQLLWEEYRIEYPEGYAYTRFCFFIKRHLDRNACVMHFEYKPGEKLMIDFAGDTMHYINRETGELIECQVFVAVFPFSNYCYVVAVHCQKLAELIYCLALALKYFGGVPACILSDCMKTAVKRSNRYEPVFTELIQQLSIHYDTTWMATRPGKPKDKPHVEAAVRNIYTRIYAPLRNREFFSLAELNTAILEQLSIHNTLPFQRKEYCRSDVFLSRELPLLKPLPQNDFELKKTVEAKVQMNYHVILGEDWHQYSVPYQFVRQHVKIVYTLKTVEIYHQLNRIAIHPRNTLRNGYSTLAEHMPPNHQQHRVIKGWNENDFKRMAGKIGPYTLSVIEKILASRFFHEQTFNTCLGILRLGKKHGEDRLETACKMTSGIPRVSYRLINNILKNHRDKETEGSPSLFPVIPEHENIRGASNYY